MYKQVKDTEKETVSAEGEGRLEMKETRNKVQETRISVKPIEQPENKFEQTKGDMRMQTLQNASGERKDIKRKQEEKVCKFFLKRA